MTDDLDARTEQRTNGQGPIDPTLLETIARSGDARSERGKRIMGETISNPSAYQEERREQVQAYEQGTLDEILSGFESANATYKQALVKAFVPDGDFSKFYGTGDRAIAKVLDGVRKFSPEFGKGYEERRHGAIGRSRMDAAYQEVDQEHGRLSKLHGSLNRDKKKLSDAVDALFREQNREYTEMQRYQGAVERGLADIMSVREQEAAAYSSGDLDQAEIYANEASGLADDIEQWSALAADYAKRVKAKDSLLDSKNAMLGQVKTARQVVFSHMLNADRAREIIKDFRNTVQMTPPEDWRRIVESGQVSEGYISRIQEVIGYQFDTLGPLQQLSQYEPVSNVKNDMTAKQQVNEAQVLIASRQAINEADAIMERRRQARYAIG